MTPTSKLDSLSLESLYALADKMGLDLPAGLERIFVVEEILEAMAEDTEERRASPDHALHVEEKKYSCPDVDGIEPTREAAGDCPPALEPRYNETMIRAIMRDPSWAFAFWDISEGDRGPLRDEDGSGGLFLRVAELGPGPEEARREYFDIPVAGEDFQWYINLPRPSVRFRIDLCARVGAAPSGKVRLLARSNEVESPRQALEPGGRSLGPDAARLLDYSGIEDLNIEAPADSNPQRILGPGSAAAPGDEA